MATKFQLLDGATWLENKHKTFPRLRVAKCTLHISNTYMGNASRLSNKKNRGLRCAQKEFSLNCNDEDRPEESLGAVSL